MKPSPRTLGRYASAGYVRSCRRPVAERFAEKWMPEPNSGCWLWLAGVNNKGYAQIPVGLSVSAPAHRVAYELYRGPIPDGLFIDHLCRTRSCVNPWHLEPVTNRENLMRGFGAAAINARKTHCDQGHEFTPANTYVRNNTGYRGCRACHRAEMAAQRKAQKNAS